MNNQNELIDFYLEKSDLIKKETEYISSYKRTIVDMFSKKPVNSSRNKVHEFYSWLKFADSEFSRYMVINKSNNPGVGVSMGSSKEEAQAAQVSIISSARNLFVMSLSAFEAEITNLDNSLNFQITTSIAMLAIIISITGSVLQQG